MILISYASRYGSTQKIASYLAKTLERETGKTQLQAIDDVVSIKAFDTLIIGSGLYLGKWLDEATEFLDSFKTQLSEKQVWLFSTGSPEEALTLKGSSYPENLKRPLGYFEPMDIATFSTKIDARQFNLEDYLLLQRMQVLEADNHNWQNIKLWGQSIAAKLTGKPHSASMPATSKVVPAPYLATTGLSKLA